MQLRSLFRLSIFYGLAVKLITGTLTEGTSNIYAKYFLVFLHVATAGANEETQTTRIELSFSCLSWALGTDHHKTFKG